jgi:hypothetical protein
MWKIDAVGVTPLKSWRRQQNDCSGRKLRLGRVGGSKQISSGLRGGTVRETKGFCGSLLRSRLQFPDPIGVKLKDEIGGARSAKPIVSNDWLTFRILSVGCHRKSDQPALPMIKQ